jgi:SagB-type dehydrogenase family enzyme
MARPDGPSVPLPPPRVRGTLAVEEAMKRRRSTRAYSRDPLSLAEAAQLLWAGNGETDSGGGRTIPSAGALYPLDLYLAAGRVDGLPAGVYRYRPERHDLVRIADGDRRGALCAAALEQSCIRSAAAVIVMTADFDRTTGTYGRRGVRYVLMEAGHAAQNVHLQAEADGLGTVVVGAFDDDVVGTILGLPSGVQAFILMPVGRIR